MRIAVVCNDTRGGIQPYVALALGLRGAGHDVRAVAPSNSSSMFSEVGLPVAALSGDVEAVLRASDGAAERGVIASMRLAARELPRIIQTWTKETLDACAGVEIVTGGIGGMVIGLSVAEKVGARFVESHLQPIGAPTDAYPGVLLPGVPRWLGGWGRRLSHRLSESALWMSLLGPMTTARKKVLGLSGAPNAARGQPVLYGFSRHVVPVPTDTDRPRFATGYWILPTPGDWAPSPALEAFLAQKGTVVTIGFGSMASRNPEALTQLVLGAVRNAGLRAVLVSGWGGLSTAAGSDDVFFADSLPYEWLFPRVAAVVHHGGAGTTGAALRAGVPAVVVPFTMDQPFWGSRVEALGAGPKPIPRKRLTESRLADALLLAVGDAEMRKRAAEVGAQLRKEDGVAEAVAHFSRLSRT